MKKLLRRYPAVTAAVFVLVSVVMLVFGSVYVLNYWGGNEGVMWFFMGWASSATWSAITLMPTKGK